MITGVFSEGTEVKELTASSFTDGALSLTFANAASIEAGKPYLIMPAGSNGYVEPVFEGVTIVKTTTPVVTDFATFTPVMKPTGFTERDKTVLFLTADGKLSFPSDNSQMKGFRAYIRLTDAAAAAPAQ